MSTNVPFRRFSRLCAALALVLFSLAPVKPRTVEAQGGGNYLVNTTRDADDNKNDPAANRTDCTQAAQGTLDPSKDCTLREAIIAANSDGGSSNITFYIPPNLAVDPAAQLPYWSIVIGGNLPRLTENSTHINGTTQAGADAQKPRIEINGIVAAEPGNDGAFATGIRIASNNNIVEGLIINNSGGNVTLNTGNGILLEAFGGNTPVSNTIRYNYIGTDESGNLSRPNGNAGIYINGSSGNTIFSNVIAGNGLNGILLNNASNNSILGNYIGVNRLGTKVANAGYGIALRAGSNNNRIGRVDDSDTPTPSTRNIISGNNFSGVIIFDSSNNNALENNYIGLSVLGSLPVPNGTPITGTNPITITYAGVEIRDGASNNTIGGLGTNRRNYIGGNDGPGILIADSGTISNTVAGNYIGVPAFGSASVGNKGSGVLIARQASNNVVGSTDTNKRNLIAGNLRYGVEISSTSIIDSFPALNSAQILSNVIGTSTYSNSLGGIYVGSNVLSVQIGNGSAAGSNIISNNGGAGIRIAGTNVLTASIISNTIGLNNNGPGIYISGVVTSTIINDNNIWNNNGSGIQLVSGAPTSSVFSPTITNNRIGTVPDSTQPNGLRDLRNGGPGILTVGAVAGLQVLSNTLAYNQGDGILISGAYTPTIQNNSIGFHLSGGAAGITLNGQTISATVRANQVFTNATGILLDSSRFAQVLTNTIRSSTNDANSAGVRILNGAVNSKVLSNSIETNLLGVRIEGSTTRFNTVQANAMRFNSGVFGAVGLLDGSNENTAPPTIAYFDRSFNVVGNVNGPGGCGGVTCTVELFAPYTSPTGEIDDDGFRLLQRATVGATGQFTINLGSFPRMLLAATTNAAGSSSQFISKTVDYSLAFTPNYDNPTLYLPSDVITYIHTLTNTGTVSDVIGLTRSSSAGWTAVVSPTSVALAPGQSTPVTVTLTVPPGGQPNSIAGLFDITTITATRSITSAGASTVTDRTGLRGEARFTLEAGSTQEVQAGRTARFTPRLSNTGNLTATLVVTASTTNDGWATTVSPITITNLGPGQSVNLGVNVSVPNGTFGGITGTTLISVTSLTSPTQLLTNTNTIIVVTTAKAEITPPEGTRQDGAAGETNIFGHTLLYSGNGPARLTLRAKSNLPGYAFEFVSTTPGKPLVGNAITLTNVIGENSIDFQVRIRVPADARVRDIQTTTIEVVDEKGVILDFATDSILIVRGAARPYAYFPIVLYKR